MKLILIRHGMTKGNQEHRYVGSTDESILPSEKERLRTSVKKYFADFFEGNEYLKDRKESCESDPMYESQDKDYKRLVFSKLKDGISKNDIYGIYISPMRRCRETAECLFPEMMAHGRYEIIEEFREMDFGAFEYRTYQEINEDPDSEYRAAYQRYIDSNGETAFPGGESKAEFCSRVCNGFTEVLKSVILKSSETHFSDVIDDPAGDETLAMVVHGGTIMALMDRFAVPHKDYFEWSLKPGDSYLVEVILEGEEICFHYVK